VPSTAARSHPEPVGAAPHAAPSLAEQVCLALIVEGVSHGWALGTLLAPDGELGRIWHLTRPLSYRAIDRLVERGLITRDASSPGRGRDRSLLAPTPAGRRMTARWLDSPVEHLRDVRTELLIKLALRQRAGLDSQTLLTTQQQTFRDTIDALVSDSGGEGFVELWRRESARAVRRFLDQAIHPPPPPGGREAGIRLSARNQLRGTITAVQLGEVMAAIKAVLGDGQQLTAAITRDAADELDLAAGDAVVMIVKSTEVMVAKS